MSALHDVAIVGAGPTGLTLAALLGRAGIDVVVCERLPAPMGLPRAVRFDHELTRVWQQLGFAEGLLRTSQPVTRYEWFGADGQPIVDFAIPPRASGWPFSQSFYQPELERALEDAVTALASVRLARDRAFASLTEHDDHVELEVVDRHGLAETVRARYVVGADGGRSAVRRALGIELEELGFGERWLVVDVLPAPDVLERLPGHPVQFCDPARPTMMGPNGRRHCRWEFMVLPGERAGDFDDQMLIWRMLEPWITPADATIVRQAVYEFRSAVAEQVRCGRCFLIGDAAHMMPPQLGEGLCSGIRDATNLAWKLDLVLRGAGSDDLLDTYGSERLPHARALVEQSLAMGRVSCELDPVAAAARDAALRADGVGEAWPFPRLGPGVHVEWPESSTALAGSLSPQSLVERDGRRGRFDDVVGNGFVVLAVDTEPETVLDGAARAGLRALGALLVGVGERRAGLVGDLDGELTGWLRAHGAAAVVLRPDFYVFGTVTRVEDLGLLVTDLLDRVGLIAGAQR